MKRPLYAAALVVYMAVILVLSLGRVPELDTGFDYIDKAYHFLAYAVMGLIWSANLTAKRRSGGSSVKYVVAVSFAASFAYGVLMEVLQHFTSHRSAELFDALSNGAGGLFGAYVGVRLFAGAASRSVQEGR